MISADEQYLASIRADTLAALRTAIGPHRDVALLDAPNQRNVGDSLIWAGEVAYFEQLGLRVRYISDLRSFDPAALRKAMPEGVVLLHGGGNLGDIWLGHQNFRERAATELQEYRIVQLPQSVHFGDPARAVQADRILGAHPDFHLLIRDSLSMEKAARDLPAVQTAFCHDMALGWNAPAVTAAPEGSLLVIARADVEASSGLAQAAREVPEDMRVTLTDWQVDDRQLRRWTSARRATRAYSKYVTLRTRHMGWLPGGMPARVAGGSIRTINDANIASATDLYAAHSRVVTDRLHAHVLAALLGRPHVVLDNSYRKVSTIFNDYTGGFSTAHYATDAREAIDICSSLVEA